MRRTCCCGGAVTGDGGAHCNEVECSQRLHSLIHVGGRKKIKWSRSEKEERWREGVGGVKDDCGLCDALEVT